MQRQVFEYDPPDRFVAGTVGEPGQRTFYLQASGGGRVTSVALEKQQVAVLGQRVDEILDDLLRASGGTAVPGRGANVDRIERRRERFAAWSWIAPCWIAYQVEAAMRLRMNVQFKRRGVRLFAPPPDVSLGIRRKSEQ